MTDLQQPLDLDDPGAEEFLDGIQGNILRSHGRNFSAHLILRISGEVAAARRWIAVFTAERVTSAAAALRQTTTFRRTGGPGEPFVMVALAADGYRALGFTDAQLPPRMTGSTHPSASATSGSA